MVGILRLWLVVIRIVATLALATAEYVIYRIARRIEGK